MECTPYQEKYEQKYEQKKEEILSGDISVQNFKELSIYKRQIEYFSQKGNYNINEEDFSKMECMNFWELLESGDFSKEPERNEGYI